MTLKEEVQLLSEHSHERKQLEEELGRIIARAEAAEKQMLVEEELLAQVADFEDKKREMAKQTGDAEEDRSFGGRNT